MSKFLEPNIPKEYKSNTIELLKAIDILNSITFLEKATGWSFREKPIIVKQGSKSIFTTPDTVPQVR